MNFTYETQGAITYLVCELESQEQLDGLALGMLTNNHIAGVAPVLYTEMNGQRFLKYNISAKVSADQFFSGTVSKERALNAFKNILNAVCSADEYMIDPKCFSVVSEHVFLNVSSCEVALVCIPTETEKDFNAELSAFFKKILISTQFESGGDTSYIAELVSYINNSGAFTVYGLRDLVVGLQAGAVSGMSNAQGVSQGVGGAPSVQSMPASSFDKTISTDQMSSMMGGAKPPIRQQPQTRMVPNINEDFARGAKPPIRQQSQMQPQRQPVPADGMMRGAIHEPVPYSGAKSTDMHVFGGVPDSQMQPPKEKKQSSGLGFAIPGQQNGGAFATPPVQTEQPKKQKKQPKKNDTPVQDNDKKMSFFGLLAHYNKENAEIYKKQKEETKAKKSAEKAKAKQSGAPAPGNMPLQFGGSGVIPSQQGGQGYNGNAAQNRMPGGAPMGQPAPQVFPGPIPQQQFRPVIQPVPVQNSFNETTVLSPSMLGGETTVLGTDPCAPAPCLTRIKTGEKININKPVFRIGKEKSYVDYFIADNTAISRSHVNIHTENGEYFVEDTNSTNHTYINGQLINSNVKVKLTSGDMVRLANEDFAFSV